MPNNVLRISQSLHRNLEENKLTKLAEYIRFGKVLNNITDLNTFFFRSAH